jgi:pilus assembly protein CpaB
MNQRTLIPLVIAGVLGLVAAISAKALMHTRPAPQQTGDLRPVVVAKATLSPGSLLKTDDLTIARATAELASDQVFADRALLVGRVTSERIVKGEPITEAVLAPAGVGEGLQALVPEGMRAVTVEVNEFTGLAGFIVPGCRVDIVARVHGEDGELQSRMVVQNMRVQAVGSRTQGISDPVPGEPIRSVTLLGTPREVEAIDLASASGGLRLVMRAGSDQAVSPIAGVTLAELRNGGTMGQMIPHSMPTTQPVAMNDASSSRQRMVQVIRGGVTTEVPMPLQPEPAMTKGLESTTGD